MGGHLGQQGQQGRREAVEPSEMIGRNLGQTLASATADAGTLDALALTEGGGEGGGEGGAGGGAEAEGEGAAAVRPSDNWGPGAGEGGGGIDVPLSEDAITALLATSLRSNFRPARTQPSGLTSALLATSHRILPQPCSHRHRI